jgi:hypothetical protein
MKSLSLALALSAFALATPALHADDISASLTTGLGTDTLIETPILNGEQFTYTNETLGLLTTENVLNSSTSTFIATYTDVSPSLAILNVDDICVNVTVAGPVVPCQAFAFSPTSPSSSPSTPASASPAMSPTSTSPMAASPAAEAPSSLAPHRPQLRSPAASA